MRSSFRVAVAAAQLLACSTALAAVGPAQAQAPAPASAQAPSEDARLTAFLDGEFAQELTLRPQLATRLGVKDGEDRLDDISESGLLKRLEWRRASVAKMKAQFDRAKLSAEAQANYDIWAQELDRAELTYKFRRYQPPFYSFLYSVHSELPNFLINTHVVQDAADMRAYSARLRALPGVLGRGHRGERQVGAIGVHAPRFEIERVISGSQTILKGAPFDDGPDSPLWADAKAKVGKLQAAGKVTPAEAEALLSEARGLAAGREAGLWPGHRLGREGASDRAKRQGRGQFPAGRRQVVRGGAQAQHHDRADAGPGPRDRAQGSDPHRGGAGRARPPGRRQGPRGLLCRARAAVPAHALDRRGAHRIPAQGQRDHRPHRGPCCRNGSACSRPIGWRWCASRPSAKWPAARPHAAGPSPDGTRPGRVYVHLLGSTDDPADVYNLMCHEGHSGPRDAGRHPGAPAERAEVPPRLRLRRLWRGLGALHRGPVQGDGRLSRRGRRLHAAGRPSCSAPRGWWSTPASMRRAGARTRPSTT